MIINRLLISFARVCAGRIALSCFIETFVALCDTLTAFCVASAVRMMVGSSVSASFSEVYQPFVGVAVLLCSRFFLVGRKARLANSGSIVIRERLRERMLSELFSRGPAFVSRERTGEMVSAIQGRVESLSSYYAVYLPTCVAAMVNAAVVLIVLFALDWAVACVCLCATLGIFLCPLVFYGPTRKRGELEWRALSEYRSECLDSVQGMVALKALNANRRQARHVHEKGEEFRKRVMEHLRVTILETGLFELLMNIGVILSLLLAAMRYMSGDIASGDLIFVLFFSAACFAPAAALGTAWHLGYRGVAATAYIADFLKEKGLECAESVPCADAARGGVVFDGVSFSYDSSEGDVLHDVSFSIPKLSTVALVGRSGSGKSTIAHLAAGFYRPRSGTVSVGGVDASHDSSERVRSLVSAVWQDSHIFYGTVAENIAMGKSSASRDEIVAAAKSACIHDFIESLPNGYDTHLGERGVRFSGGERQRVSLARAFLRNSPIVIFDEVTSALDPGNEREVKRSFERLRKDRTVLVIAHRLSTIEDADLIYVVDDGRIVDSGNHEDLLRTSARYRDLMESQIGEGVA